MAFPSGIDPAHVEAEVRRLLEPSRRSEVLTKLAGIRACGGEEVWRKLAALHLAEGQPHLIEQYVRMANTDVRELIMSIDRLPRDWDKRFEWPAL